VGVFTTFEIDADNKINTNIYMIKLLSTFIVLTVLGILYDKYKAKYVKDEELDKYSIIQKFLLNGQTNADIKPVLWIHTTHDINARNWNSFYSRNSRELNQPYLSLCLESIVKNCADSFNICLIDDDSFIKLLPKWNIVLNDLASPIKEHVRSLAMARILYIYGGMQIPMTTILFKNLYPLYSNSLTSHDSFVGETINGNISSTYTHTYTNKDIIGCKRNSNTMLEYIKYLEVLNSRDHTNEIEFIGDIERVLYRFTHENKMKMIPATFLGATDSQNKDILIDDLLSDTYININDDCYCIVIPHKELLTRSKFAWFNRLSRPQVLTAKTMISKFLLIALHNGAYN
tara:strand:- start:17166 stop:18200 length:1035 start_codon:yes stop_codon:yes gene_type:complete